MSYGSHGSHDPNHAQQENWKGWSASEPYSSTSDSSTSSNETGQSQNNYAGGDSEIGGAVGCLFLIVILGLGYAGYRYWQGQPILPQTNTSVTSATEPYYLTQPLTSEKLQGKSATELQQMINEIIKAQASKPRTEIQQANIDLLTRTKNRLKKSKT